MAKILVIDDEKNVREMIRLALENVGHTVDTAVDGQSGLEKFGTGEDWDLVLLDQRLPNETEGTDVFSEMVERRPGTKALLITAYGSINVAIESLKAGMISLLRKPFSTDQLRSMVNEALIRSCKKSEAIEADDVINAISRTSQSGFKFSTVNSSYDDKLGEWTVEIDAENPDGQCSEVRVHVPRYVIELAKALADCESVPGKQQFWIGLAEEALAHYTLIHGGLPPEGKLEVDDIDAHLRRWLDSVMTVR